MFIKFKRKRKITAFEKNAIIIEYLTQQIEWFKDDPDTKIIAEVCDDLRHFEQVKRRYLRKG